ncbi:hypothetical protein ACIG53_23340 [Streptomyces bauhiniae]|uniref:hypothetical protein n=1 Tax=Streptomyces bauhiniae TaxID=2340725 RepID=UPI0037D0987B
MSTRPPRWSGARTASPSSSRPANSAELALFRTCLDTLRANGMRAGRSIEVDGAVLTVYEG